MRPWAFHFSELFQPRSVTSFELREEMPPLELELIARDGQPAAHASPRDLFCREAVVATRCFLADIRRSNRSAKRARETVEAAGDVGILSSCRSARLARAALRATARLVLSRRDTADESSRCARVRVGARGFQCLPQRHAAGRSPLATMIATRATVKIPRYTSMPTTLRCGLK